jgi:hypothetical protein
MNSESVELYNIMQKKIDKKDFEIADLKFELSRKTNRLDEITNAKSHTNLTSLVSGIFSIVLLIDAIHEQNIFYILMSLSVLAISVTAIIESICDGCS